MQWTRIAKLSALLTACVAAVIGFSPAQRFVAAEMRSYADRPNPVVATPEETRTILAAVLAKEKFEGVPPPPPPPSGPGELPPQRAPEPTQVLILVDRSACFVADSKTSDCERISLEDLTTWPSLNSFAPLKFRRELMVSNQEPYDVDLRDLPDTKVFSRAEIRATFAKGGWRGFYAKYPGSSGFAETSRPVLMGDRKQALVYVAYHCGDLCGVGLLLMLEQSGSGWRVVKEEQLWVS